MLATVKDFEDYFNTIIKRIIDECVVEVHFSSCTVRDDYDRQAITVIVFKYSRKQGICSGLIKS